jgi:putative oxidoreductase
MQLRSRSILLGAVLLSAAVGVANNAASPRGVPWIGSPEVLQQNPVDAMAAASEPHSKGIAQGIRFAWKELAGSAAPIAVVAGAVLLLSVLLWRLRKAQPGELAEGWFRLGMAAMLLAACWGKLASPADFADAVAQYQMLPRPLVDAFSIWLPAFELVVALGLALSPRPREMYLLLAALFGMFIIALGQALARRLGITCGCFALREAYSGVGEAWSSLLRDVVLLVPTALLARGTRRRFVWQLSRGPRETEPGPMPSR